MDHKDEDLIQKYLKGNEGAVSMIFERYKGRVLNFCLRILGNRADAEDATGEVFLAVFAKKYTLDPHAQFSTWLFTVARNCCINRIRKRKGMVSLWFAKDGGEESLWDIPDEGENSAQELEKKEAKVRVRQAIQRLPLEQREAIILREYNNFSYNEIAKVLQCSLEKVKILIYRARENLRGDLLSFHKEGHDA